MRPFAQHAARAVVLTLVVLAACRTSSSSSSSSSPAATPTPVPAAVVTRTTYTSGDEVIGAMRARYAGKWYSTLTFTQKTSRLQADGKWNVQTWYEAMRLLRGLLGHSLIQRIGVGAFAQRGRVREHSVWIDRTQWSGAMPRVRAMRDERHASHRQPATGAWPRLPPSTTNASAVARLAGAGLAAPRSRGTQAARKAGTVRPGAASPSEQRRARLGTRRRRRAWLQRVSRQIRDGASRRIPCTLEARTHCPRYGAASAAGVEGLLRRQHGTSPCPICRPSRDGTRTGRCAPERAPR